MNENKVYEITTEVEHLNIILKALSCYINVMYETINNEIVSMKDVQKTFEDIKVCSDIQIVLKHALGKTMHSPKQTSENTNLIWCKEVDLERQAKLFEDISNQGSTGEAYIRTRQEIRDHAAKLAQRLLTKKYDKEFQNILKK